MGRRRPIRRSYAEAWDIVLKNQGLVRHLAKKFHSTETEDLISHGNLAMFRAAQLFNKSKGRFSTYAGKAVCSRLSRYMMGDRNLIHVPEKSVYEARKGLNYLASMAHSPIYLDSTYEFIEQKQEQKRDIPTQVLSERYRRIISCRYGLNQAHHTMQETAVIFGISKARVGQIVKKSIEKMRSTLVS